MQVPVTLTEYSLNAVTEGIDAIATTRVVIRAEDSNSLTSTHAMTGKPVIRAFRYRECDSQYTFKSLQKLKSVA